MGEELAGAATRTVSYAAQTLDTPNPIARYAHRQRYKASFDQVTSDVRQGGTVLDFGCGQGDFLNTLADLRPDLTLIGFDPESGHEAERYTPVDDMTVVADESVDLVCCFETLEHLYDDEIASFLADGRASARAGRRGPDLGAGHRGTDPAAQGSQPGGAVPPPQRLLGRRAAGRLVRGVAPRRAPTTSG